ncbi:MAG: GTPase HflX, partial [Paracoccaceae bacterium]
NSVRAGLLFGKGRVEDLARTIAAREIGLVVIDAPVSPVQQRNLERKWETRVLDRTGLILEIFADRAATREGVLQVDLAALIYQRSRLVRSWTHLERQRGGLSFVGGAGETQIESDRRQIDTAIVRLRRQLEKVARTRALHRQSRKKVPFPVVALVGYTNAGKSTLFNRLTGADEVARDMLFATLDPKMRSLTLPDGQKAILSDTVGFISDLPTQLVAAFRATLEEVLDADLILHVRDISHPESKAQAADVLDVMSAIGIDPFGDTPVVEIWNKTDLLAPEQVAALGATAGRKEAIVSASALTGAGLDAVLAAIGRALAKPRQQENISLGYDEGRRRAWLHDQNVVIAEKSGKHGYEITVRWTGRQAKRFERV